MLKKIKTLDLFSLISSMLLISFVVFFIAAFILTKIEIKGFNDSSTISAEQGLSNYNLILKILFYYSIASGAVGEIISLVCSIVSLITDWEDDELNNKSKVLGIINLFPIFLGVPLCIFTNSLIKVYIKNERELSQSLEDDTYENNAISYNIDEPFVYNDKWMYFDGVDFYEADSSNNWIKSKTIPN